MFKIELEQSNGLKQGFLAQWYVLDTKAREFRYMSTGNEDSVELFTMELEDGQTMQKYNENIESYKIDRDQVSRILIDGRQIWEAEKCSKF